MELRARQQQHAAQRTVTAARLAAFLTSVEAEDGDSIGRDTFFANSASFDLIDLDGNTHDVDSALYSLDGYFRGGTFYPGTRSSGQMVFRIPEGSAPARLILGSGARVELDLRVAPSR